MQTKSFSQTRKPLSSPVKLASFNLLRPRTLRCMNSINLARAREAATRSVESFPHKARNSETSDSNQGNSLVSACLTTYGRTIQEFNVLLRSSTYFGIEEISLIFFSLAPAIILGWKRCLLQYLAIERNKLRPSKIFQLSRRLPSTFIFTTLYRALFFVIPNRKAIYNAETRGFIKYLSCIQAAKNSTFFEAINFLFLAAVIFYDSQNQSVNACSIEQKQRNFRQHQKALQNGVDSTVEGTVSYEYSQGGERQFLSQLLFICFVITLTLLQNTLDRWKHFKTFI